MSAAWVNAVRDRMATIMAAMLCPLASAITGEVMFVDCGYNIMGVPPDDLEQQLKS